MVETPRLQAKQVLGCRKATCHSGLRAGIQQIGAYQFWMPVKDPVFSGDQVRHDGLVSPTLKLLISSN